MSDDDPARRAVACKRWRWMPGMLDHYGRRVLDVNTGRNNGVPVWWTSSNDATCEEVYDRPDDGRLLFAAALPDLTDTATLGCLLALVRETWGEPHVYVRRVGLTVWQVIATTVIVTTGQPDGFRERILATGPSERHALVAALEAVP
jgi:hypothetical protein